MTPGRKGKKRGRKGEEKDTHFYLQKKRGRKGHPFLSSKEKDKKEKKKETKEKKDANFIFE